MAKIALREFVKNLLLCSEKSAAIGRFLKSNAAKVNGFVEEKASVRAELRRGMDFKTMADVLIQQSIIFDLGNVYPQLVGRIFGEESSFFVDMDGNKFSMQLQQDPRKMKEVLTRFIHNEEIISNLIDILYNPSDLNNDLLSSLDSIPLDRDIDLNQYAIWIDPIDGTAQYLECDEFIQYKDNSSSLTIQGLCCCFVLIGVYHRPSGRASIGIMNQVFTSPQDGEERNVLWGICLPDRETYSNVRKSPSTNNNVVVSFNEKLLVLNSCQYSWHTVPVSTAGYKFWHVIAGNACAFLLTRASCYKWDTCASHAILKSLGGNVFSLPLLQTLYSNQPSLFEGKNLSDELELTYWNSGCDAEFFSPMESSSCQDLFHTNKGARVSLCDNILFVNRGGFIASLDPEICASIFMHIKDHLSS